MNDRELLHAFAKTVRYACIEKCTEIGERTDMHRIDMVTVVENFLNDHEIELCHICGFSRDRVGSPFCSAPHAVSYPVHVQERGAFAIEQLESLLAVVDSYRPSEIPDLLKERIEAIRSRTTAALGPSCAPKGWVMP